MNYRITEADPIGVGNLIAKFQTNLEVIRLLKQLESEKRQATPKEQSLLTLYNGWGPAYEVFKNPGCPEEVQLLNELKELLNPEEYAAAQHSTLSASYTSPTVIKAIYAGLKKLGFSGGRIIDPGMGIGCFLGFMPDSMYVNSDWTGVELDKITGRIVQQLYPQAEIYIQGFEHVALPENSFDLAIGSVPFVEKLEITDPLYQQIPISTLYDYFFVKSLSLIRPGGLLVFITSPNTLDSPRGEAFREFLSEKTNLLLALRLPDNTFLENANSEGTTDLIVLQKLEPGKKSSGESWTKLASSGFGDSDRNALTINEYYVRHPERLLGHLALDPSKCDRLTVKGDNRHIGKAIEESFPSYALQK